MQNTAYLENVAVPTDRIDEVVKELEEIEGEYGRCAILAALLRSDIAEKMGGNPDAMRRVLQSVLREIVMSDDPKLQAEIMAIGSGVLDCKGIVRKVASKHGLTPAAISKRVIQFCDEWALPPSGSMKSEASRTVYAKRNQPRLS